MHLRFPFIQYFSTQVCPWPAPNEGQVYDQMLVSSRDNTYKRSENIPELYCIFMVILVVVARILEGTLNCGGWATPPSLEEML